jgi:hypothetical protein
MPQIIRQRGAEPGRHHPRTVGDIISERLGDFVGIRNLIEMRQGARIIEKSKDGA